MNKIETWKISEESIAICRNRNWNHKENLKITKDRLIRKKKCESDVSEMSCKFHEIEIRNISICSEKILDNDQRYINW